MNKLKKLLKLALLIPIFIISCKDNEEVPYLGNNNDWKKVNNYSLTSSVADTKLFPNGNIGVLEQNYALMDSNGNILQTYQLPQLSVYRSPRIASVTYVNYSGNIVSNTNRRFIFAYLYNNEGYMSQSSIIESYLMVPIKVDEYATILDEKTDKPNKKSSLKLFLVNINDSIKNYRYWVTRRDVFTNYFDTSYFELPGFYERFRTTNNHYLFYSERDDEVIVYDKDFNQTGGGYRSYKPSCVRASDEAFYIQYSNNLYKTTNGNDYTLLSDKFYLQDIVNDTTLVGLSDKQPAIFNLNNNSITIIGKNGLPDDYSNYSDYYKITAIGKKLYWFSQFGTFMKEIN
jgi:hypothetical protein